MSTLDRSTSLPASWNFVPLKELGDWSGGGTPSKAKPQYWQGGTIPWVSPKDMKTERISDSEDHITKEAVSHSAACLINADSVLIVTRSGILRHTLPVAVNSVPVTVNQDLKALTPRNGIMAEYVAWALRAFSRDILHACSKQGTTVNSVETSKLLGFEIPVAPRSQQAKIVAEIEKQFSRLDEAVANLKRVKANLKRYKAAVLKAAVEGKLTAEWRKLHPDVEPASKLLERILAERRAKWNGRAGYSAPVQPDISNFPELPNGWVWVRLDTIAALKGGITVDKNRKSSTARTVPYLRVANVQRGYLDLSEVKEIKAPEADIRDLRLEPGDILFNEGGDRDKLGRGWVWEGQLSECIHQNHVFRARLYLADVSPKLVSWWGNSFGQTYFLREGKQTTNLASINITKLSAFPIPFLPTAEQQQIVAEVERRLSVIEELEAAVEANLTRADRLRQSILGQAFSGELIQRGEKEIAVRG